MSHEVVVNLIQSTRTKIGLKIKAKVDKPKYPPRVKVANEAWKTLNLEPHGPFHGEWNYTLRRILKSILFRDEVAPRLVRFGVGRGLVLLLNRRHELQKELGLWEIEAQPIYARWVRPGTTVFDIGAADGDSALLLAKLAAPGAVVAFEPDSALRRQLAENAALNPDLPTPQIEAAYVGSRDKGDGTVTLDAVVARGVAPPPSFIKIDVDGAELDVLIGMQQVLTIHHPVVFIEVHGTDREQHCLAFLSAREYTVEIVKNAWWRRLWPEHRPIGHNRWLLARPILASP